MSLKSLGPGSDLKNWVLTRKQKTERRSVRAAPGDQQALDQTQAGGGGRVGKPGGGQVPAWSRAFVRS